jgi:hypothetical protein
MNEDQFVGRRVMFGDKAAGKKGKSHPLTGTVRTWTPAGPGSRYDRMTIQHKDGTVYTRDASTVKFLREGDKGYEDA